MSSDFWYTSSGRDGEQCQLISRLMITAGECYSRGLIDEATLDKLNTEATARIWDICDKNPAMRMVVSAALGLELC